MMLRPYVKDDRDEAAALFLDVFLHEPWHYHWMKEKDVRRYFMDMENTPNFAGFVYEREKNAGIPCGSPGILTASGEIVGLCFGIINDYFSCVWGVKP